MTPTAPLHGDEPWPPGPAGPRTPLLYHLVYCSRAAPSVDEAMVDDIVRTAQRHNPAQGITGLLVFGGGLFFQWLEGPRDTLQALLARLQRDARHSHIVLLTEDEEARERLFPDWAMERVSAHDVRPVLEDARANAHNPANAQALDAMLAELDRQLPDNGA